MLGAADAFGDAVVLLVAEEVCTEHLDDERTVTLPPVPVEVLLGHPRLAGQQRDQHNHWT